MHILSPETDNCPSWISGREGLTVENISWSLSTKECCRPRRGLNPRPPDLQSDGAANWATEAGIHPVYNYMYLHVTWELLRGKCAFVINAGTEDRSACAYTHFDQGLIVCLKLFRHDRIYRKHYENTPMQINRKFYLQKNWNLSDKKNPKKTSYIFHISAQSIECGYSLEPPRRGGSNKYPQSLF